MSGTQYEERLDPHQGGELEGAGPVPAPTSMLGAMMAQAGASAVQRKLVQRVIQRRGATRGEAGDDAAQVHKAAAEGTSSGGGALPYLDRIQASFGPQHDVSGVTAHTGSEARVAAKAMNAEAFAVGEHVAFGGAPSLHTAAHEAAHVVQQRGGVQLKGGVGEEGDAYERNADAVADRVVRGESAADLLAPFAGGGQRAGGGAGVQMLGHELGKPLPADAEKPAYGEDKDQRRYSVEQYLEMWEKEQGRKLTEQEKATIARGCIGITANNLSAGGNPPLDNAYSTFEAAHDAMGRMNESLDALRAKPETAAQAQGKHAVVFAKMFWSNQDPDQEKRKKPDDKAFRPDEHGKVDMSGYEYRAQPGYINFDYAFWDEASQSFWHANHSQPGMKVYQSTKDRFARGYIDFDRVIYCVAIAENYDPGLAAMAHAGRR